jgi:anti-sigma regulatory factor (Ser/Thr protein kinase)
MTTPSAHRSFCRMIESLDQIFDFLSSFMSANTVGEDVAYEIKLAVEEAFVNMVKHNAQSQEDVSISLNVSDGRLTIVLVDRDVDPFDPTQAPAVDVDRPAHERPVGGLGVYLIRELMDDVRYDYSDGTSTLTLIKNLESHDV